MQLDLREKRCPQSLIEAKLALKNRQANTPVQMWVRDPASVKDILRYIDRQHLACQVTRSQNGETIITVEQ